MNLLWGNRYIQTGAQTRYFALGAAFNQNAITGRARSQARITKGVASLREIHVTMTPRTVNKGANGEKVFFGIECKRPGGDWETLGDELEWETDGVTRERSLTGLNASCPAGSHVVAYARTETSIGVSPTYMHITGVFR
mgnify:CR=1 FL=1